MRQPLWCSLVRRLVLVAALVGSNALLARGLDGPPAAVTPKFEDEGLLYGDDGAKGMTPEERLASEGPPAQNLCFAYSPDGKTLAVGDAPHHAICAFPVGDPVNENGGLIRLLDTATDRVWLTLRPAKVAGHEYEVRRITFSPDGKTLIAAGLERNRADRPSSILGLIEE